MELAIAGLVLMGISGLGGTGLYVLARMTTKDRERTIDTTSLVLHSSFAVVAVAVWFVYAAGASEFGGARALVPVLLAVVLLAGLAMLRTVLTARRNDPDGERIAEAAINPLHIVGHVLVGVAAIAVVLIAAIRG